PAPGSVSAGPARARAPLGGRGPSSSRCGPLSAAPGAGRRSFHRARAGGGPCAFADADRARAGGRPAWPGTVAPEARDEVLAGAAHARREIHLRAIAEQPLRLRDVGERVAHVARARRGVGARQAAVEEVADRVGDGDERVARAAGDVEDLARHPRRRHREQVSLHHVVDVGEVARLLAVAVHLERLARERLGEEARDHGRVLRLRVLPRPEDVEVAQAHRLEPVEAREGLAVVLRRQLGDRVGRDRPGGEGLDLGERRVVAVDRGRRRVHHAPHARVAAGQEEDERPGHVHLVGAERVVDRARHGAERRLVKHAVHPRDGAAYHGRVAQVALDHLDARLRRQVLALAAGAARAATPLLALPLALEESAGVARHAWPASASVPLPRGRVQSPDKLWLAAPGGRAAPLQARALERWPDGSVRWLLLDFLADVPAGQAATFTLRDGAPPAPASGARVRLEAGRDGARVLDTGALHATVPARGEALLADLAAGPVRLAGAVPLPALAVDGAPGGAPSHEGVTVETEGAVRTEL